jgi:hypothetical protein
MAGAPAAVQAVPAGKPPQRCGLYLPASHSNLVPRFAGQPAAIPNPSCINERCPQPAETPRAAFLLAGKPPARLNAFPRFRPHF